MSNLDNKICFFLIGFVLVLTEIVIAAVDKDVMSINVMFKWIGIAIKSVDTMIILMGNSAIPTKNSLISIRKSSDPIVFTMKLVSLSTALTKVNAILIKNEAMPVDISLLSMDVKLMPIDTDIKETGLTFILIRN